MTERKGSKQGLDRRQFLRSVFGLGGVAEGAQPEAEARQKNNTPAASKFFWADLRTGQMGFPCGHAVPVGRPGSIMKLVTAAALIDGKIMSADHKLECRGVYKSGKETYKCLQAHGSLDMVHAIGLSCNIYFVQAAKNLSAQGLLDYAAKFGFGKPVADFSGGKFPQAQASGSGSEKYVLGLSQELQANALQIMRVSALVASEGRVPYLHSAECPDPDAGPFELSLSPNAWKTLEEGMRIASRDGTGKELDPQNKLKIALKTGTTPHGTSFQSWVTGYFPWDLPRYAFVLRASAGTSMDEAIPQARKFLFAAEWP